MLKRSLLILIFLSALGLASNTQIISLKAAKADLISALDSILQSQVNQDKIPGAVIEIKIGDQIIYKHAFGYAQKYDYSHHLLNPP